MTAKPSLDDKIRLDKWLWAARFFKTRALAKELVGDGIRVNAVAPGVIATPIHDAHTSSELLAQLSATIPMGRLGRADEIAGMAAYLASDDASFVTGSSLTVDGGYLA